MHDFWYALHIHEMLLNNNYRLRIDAESAVNKTELIDATCG